MTQTYDFPDVATTVRPQAELAARQRILNAFIAETGCFDPRVDGGPEFRLRLPAVGRVLAGTLVHWSVMGHHIYGEELLLSDQEDGARSAPLAFQEFIDLILTELAAREGGAEPGQRALLAAQIDNSVERATRYLSRGRAPRPAADRPQALTRHAEQSMLLGHPLHPTPKSAEGFDDNELDCYSQELGASFLLEYFAVAPEHVRRQQVRPAVLHPEEVLRHARATSVPPDAVVLPAHPWQADYLRQRPRFKELINSGEIVPLGALGRSVYPTSSVRTVCDPQFSTVWKLPLHVRITNFVRNNPPEHAERAMDASRFVAACRAQVDHPGFEVLIETATIGLADPRLAADTTVLFRENPFTGPDLAPQVIGTLLEALPGGEEPYLLEHVRQAGGVPSGRLPADAVLGWFERYLGISLVPLLRVFDTTGISLEAHVQNSLLHLHEGWPDRFYVRDMEGVSVSRQLSSRIAAGRELPGKSALLYDHEKAWHRLQYYGVTNHFGYLVHTLAHHGGVDERLLWSVVRNVLRGMDSEHAVRLLEAPTLPLKANLSSRLAGTSERPSYAQVPNPILEVAP